MPSRKMRTAVYFFMGWMLRFGRNGPPRAVYPPGWGVMYFGFGVSFDSRLVRGERWLCHDMVTKLLVVL